MFIVFEGGEGTGKTTQAKLLDEALKLQGHQTLLTREPGGTELGKVLREAVNHEQLHPKTELFLILADRAHHVGNVILPALESNKIVICDRYWDSTKAYQLDAGEISYVNMWGMVKWSASYVYPDLVFVLDAPIEITRARFQDRLKLTNFETRGSHFHNKVRQSFLDTANKNPFHHVIIDVSKPSSTQEVHNKILDYVTEALKRSPNPNE